MIKIYQAKCNVEGNKVIFYSRNAELSKILYNKRNSVKNTVLKSILLRDSYEIELLKTIADDNIKKEALMNEIQLIKKSQEQKEKQALHNLTYNQDVESGKTIEEQYKQKIEKWFNDTLISTKWRYAKVDFIGSNNMMYEVKSFKGNFGDFPHVIIGTNKLICENLVFVFVFGNKDAYFIRSNFELFEPFEKSNLKNPNRIYYNEVFKIPNEHLIKLTNESSYTLNPFDNELEKEMRKAIFKDEQKG